MYRLQARVYNDGGEADALGYNGRTDCRCDGGTAFLQHEGSKRAEAAVCHRQAHDSSDKACGRAEGSDSFGGNEDLPMPNIKNVFLDDDLLSEVRICQAM